MNFVSVRKDSVLKVVFVFRKRFILIISFLPSDEIYFLIRHFRLIRKRIEGLEWYVLNEMYK